MSELDRLNSSASATSDSSAPQKRARARFGCWSFDFTFCADSTAFNGGGATGCVTLRVRQMFLRAHLTSRVAHTMPPVVTFVTAFYDATIITGTLSEDVSVSISLHGYVQSRANASCELSTVQKWMPCANWRPVCGGLASHPEFRADASRSEDPNTAWTQMILYGNLSLNNAAKMERKKLREASHLHSIVLSVFIRTCLECDVLMRFRTTGGKRGGGGSTRGRKAAGVERCHKSPPASCFRHIDEQGLGMRPHLVHRPSAARRAHLSIKIGINRNVTSDAAPQTAASSSSSYASLLCPVP